MQNETKARDQNKSPPAHTPTPWAISDQDASVIVYDRFKFLAQTGSITMPTKQKEANAALIVRAVNCHAQQHAALLLAERALSIHGRDTGSDAHRAWLAVRGAIGKAEGA